MSEKYTPQISPAYDLQPGTRVLPEGVVFSVVLRDCTECGLILYHLPDLKPIRIPFEDEYRIGSLYSVLVKDLNPRDWAYRYYRDDYEFVDSCARELLRVKADGKDALYAKLFPIPECSALPAPALPELSWQDELVYCLHVKGFTASRTSKAAKKGTFAGLVEKIPHLVELGVTAVELLPLYELRPESCTTGKEKVRRLKNESEPERINYWNFGEGCYFAPKAAYSAGSSPSAELYGMIEKLHEAGIRVYMQLYFPPTVSIQTALEAARFYKLSYHVDGFHLKGDDAALKLIASDPILSDSVLFYYGFPYSELQEVDRENPESGVPSVYHLAEYNDRFSTLLRRFVKSDDLVLREFIQEFVRVSPDHGSIRYVTNYEGFTLMDLVSYNRKHNELNGEDNRDGNDYNESWNCGVEGKSRRAAVRELRLRQIRNFLTLLFLSQGTPLLYAGDEMCNSQEGNNNAYCQDNELGWTCWRDTADSRAILSFTKEISSFRATHGVFRARKPFSMTDTLVCGYPDLSFHGKEAWKPDFGGYNHTIGLLYCENYAAELDAAEEDAAEEKDYTRLLYLAVNMHWHPQELGVPTAPAGTKWYKIMDTFEDQSFLAEPVLIRDAQQIHVPGRTIQILCNMPEKPVKEAAGVNTKEAAHAE
ncbi:MAG: hypothetical protein J6M46_00140 [Lachnospiraceae bacterium]|nr:hypothetical protein [Lachnospiraceae bacterium]